LAEAAGLVEFDVGGAGRAASGDGPDVTSVVMSSAQVSPGSLFACVPGTHADGHDYAAQAVARGAVALLCERQLPLAVPQLVVPSVRRAVGPLSAACWGRPAASMTVVGVTGTNGKTTTCALLASIFQANGWRTGVLGTLTGARTTPEAPELQRRLAELRDGGTRAVAMEVSSHALSQARVDGTEMAAGVFTNLSQDHLDYHRTMDAYFEAKALLFRPGLVRLAVVNREGPWGARLVARLEGGSLPLVTYGAEDATQVVLGQRSASFTWRGERINLNVPGRFNVTNAVAAATTARELGVGWDAVISGLAAVAPVRGRFEPVEAGQPFTVLVDFAHTPAALGESLTAARELVGAKPGREGRLIVVFGAGGDRDRGKRPLMGRVASELADLVVITSDNPRSEKPLAIVEEVAGGVVKGQPLVELDRARAIAGALSIAGPGDVVVIAGKGHETGQDFGDHVEDFDDAEVAHRVLVERWSGTGIAGVSGRAVRP
jgi:UDP-N-acetylmuramoyl-L-alanyl-D-glutamate--2,6-diaminopimelate ligase